MNHLLVLALISLVGHAMAALKGIDVSAYQPHVNWNTVKSNGVSFAYIKATESTNYISPTFSSQYTGATKAGLIRGSYHFAHPGKTSGAAQANYFLKHGGGWTSDGITLPGALDLENQPKGSECWGLSKSAMVAWIKDFSDTYKKATGRPPVIYARTNWWTSCTGNSKAFSENPLWIARYGSSPGTLPASWKFYTFWQNSDNASPNPGDSDIFNGNAAQLSRFAKGS